MPEGRPHVLVHQDARVLAVDVTGDPEGYPVFLMHGTPGSRYGPKPRGIVLHRMGIRLISYDRPGYGDSDPQEGRSVADAAADVRAIADYLGIPRFAVVGRSGGGPHALACGALMPTRVTSVAALVSFAPPDADGLDWYQGMAEQNVTEYTKADTVVSDLIEDVKRRAYEMQDDPESLIRLIESALCSLDRRVIDDRALRKLITSSYEVAVQQGPSGWIDDTLALRKNWGFDLADITSPVQLWHGEEDAFAPRSHTEWLAARIPHAQYQVEPNAGHFRAVEILPEILAWLTDQEPAPADEPYAMPDMRAGVAR